MSGEIIEFKGRFIRKVYYYCYRNWTDAWDGYVGRTRWVVVRRKNEFELVNSEKMKFSFLTLGKAKDYINKF